MSLCFSDEILAIRVAFHSTVIFTRTQHHIIEIAGLEVRHWRFALYLRGWSRGVYGNYRPSTICIYEKVGLPVKLYASESVSAGWVRRPRRMSSVNQSACVRGRCGSLIYDCSDILRTRFIPFHIVNQQRPQAIARFHSFRETIRHGY